MGRLGAVDIQIYYRYALLQVAAHSTRVRCRHANRLTLPLHICVKSNPELSAIREYALFCLPHPRVWRADNNGRVKMVFVDYPRVSHLVHLRVWNYLRREIVAWIRIYSTYIYK